MSYSTRAPSGPCHILCNRLNYVTWNEGMERMWGALLGYSDTQNDWWIAHLRHEGVRTGA